MVLTNERRLLGRNVVVARIGINSRLLQVKGTDVLNAMSDVTTVDLSNHLG
jgi:hypothetical protein